LNAEVRSGLSKVFNPMLVKRALRKCKSDLPAEALIRVATTAAKSGAMTYSFRRKFLLLSKVSGLATNLGTRRARMLFRRVYGI
jgi:hypothetical protein